MDTKEQKNYHLKKLYEPYKKCMECPLGSLGRTQVVFGEGNPDSHLMIIGEGPGAEEDAQGRPFVGRSGKLLTRILTQAGIDRSDIFITNIVKCRPPNNRAPLQQEAATCMDLLLFKQIEIIKPKVICTLGACALQNLTGTKAQITKIHGIPFEWKDYTIIPAYHPAYVLRNPSTENVLLADILKAKTLSD